MAKYYRVKKDTFMWLEGAILVKNDRDNGYEATSDIWDAVDLDGEYITPKIIENNPEWFERVYEVSVLGKAKYIAKDAARKVHDELYQAK